MAAVVVDSSVAASWLLPDEAREPSQELAALIASSGAIAPSLLIYEVRNLLITAVRRQRLSVQLAHSLIDDFRNLPIELVELSSDSEIIELGIKHSLSGYDATFLALAMQTKLPLATYDRKLKAAAVSEGIELIAD